MKYLIIIILFLVTIFLIANHRTRTPEYFGSEESSKQDVDAGASDYWGWGFKGIDEKTGMQRNKCPKCDQCNIVIDDKSSCRYCDITRNKDIDKYVLKSSVPPCPDMSNFATKSMVNSCPDMNKYVLKSKLPEYCMAFIPNSDQYMLKTQCQPSQQDSPQSVVIQDITTHPDFNKYISKENCKKYKKSWTQDFDEWFYNLFNSKTSPPQNQQNQQNNDSFPSGYGFSPYAGYGTDNTGYALDGGNVIQPSINLSE